PVAAAPEAATVPAAAMPAPMPAAPAPVPPAPAPVTAAPAAMAAPAAIAAPATMPAVAVAHFDGLEVINLIARRDGGLSIRIGRIRTALDQRLRHQRRGLRR